MEESGNVIKYGDQFYRAVLDEDDAALDDVLDRMGKAEEVVVLLSCLLAVLVREVFGAAISLEDIAGYARKVSSDFDPGPRRIALESVLRTGAGYDRILSGLPDEERLEAAVVLVRYMAADVERNSLSQETIIERSLQLVAVRKT
jgi:hypothetical protein